MRRAALLALSVALLLPTGALADTRDAAAELIPFLMDELADVREALDGRQAGDEGGWFTAGAADYQDDLDRLLDRALGIVAPDAHARWTEEVQRIDAALAEAEALQAELRLAEGSARRSEGAGMVDRLLGREHPPGTLEDLAARLEAADAAIRTLRTERADAAAGFADELRSEHGVTLTPEQAKSALFTVHGGLMVESVVVLRGLAEVERQLGAVLERGISVENGRSYLGVASVTRLVHARMLSRHLDAYDDEWLPRLAEMRDGNEALLAATRAAAAASRLDSVRARYETNADIQRRTIEVIDLYDTVLRERRRITEAALAEARERADAAINTLKTLEAAAAVSSLVDQSWEEFEAISEVEVPDLLALEGEAFDQFLDISRQLAAGS